MNKRSLIFLVTMGLSATIANTVVAEIPREEKLLMIGGRHYIHRTNNGKTSYGPLNTKITDNIPVTEISGLEKEIIQEIDREIEEAGKSEANCTNKNPNNYNILNGLQYADNGTYHLFHLYPGGGRKMIRDEKMKIEKEVLSVPTTFIPSRFMNSELQISEIVKIVKKIEDEIMAHYNRSFSILKMTKTISTIIALLAPLVGTALLLIGTCLILAQISTNLLWLTKTLTKVCEILHINLSDKTKLTLLGKAINTVIRYEKTFKKNQVLNIFNYGKVGTAAILGAESTAVLTSIGVCATIALTCTLIAFVSNGLLIHKNHKLNKKIQIEELFA